MGVGVGHDSSLPFYLCLSVYPYQCLQQNFIGAMKFYHCNPYKFHQILLELSKVYDSDV